MGGVMDTSALFTQLGGGVVGTAAVLFVIYWQYKRRPGTLDGKTESAGIAMIESMRQDAESARKDAAAARDDYRSLRAELRERDRLARVHEAYDRSLLEMLSKAGLLTQDLGVPPPLVPPLED